MRWFKNKAEKEVLYVKLNEELESLKLKKELEELKKNYRKRFSDTRKKDNKKNQIIYDLNESYMAEVSKNIVNCLDIKRLEDDVVAIKSYHANIVKEKDIEIAILTDDLRVYQNYVDNYVKKGDL